MMGIVV